MIAGAARRSPIVSKSGTIGSVQDLDARFVEKKPRLLGEQIDAEDVDRRTRHRQNKSAEGFAVELRAHLGDDLEHFDDVARIGGKLVARERRRPRLCKLGDQPFAPFGSIEVGRRLAAGLHAPQLLERLRRARRVLADVEAHRAEAESFHRAAQRTHEIRRERVALGFIERLFERQQVGDEFVGARIARTCRRFGVHGAQRLVELAQNRHHELPVGLILIARFDRRAVRQRGEAFSQLLAERLRNIGGALADRQHAREIDEAGTVVIQARRSVFAHGAAGDVIRHERIAVAVAADPGPELEERRDLECFVGIVASQRAFAG